MIPARRSAASRHLSSAISRTSRHHALPLSSIPIIRTVTTGTGKRPTLQNKERSTKERITSQNSNWRIYRRGYALGTASKCILCFARHVSKPKTPLLQDTTRLPHFDKILIANRYEIILSKNFRKAISINIEAKLLVVLFVPQRNLGSGLLLYIVRQIKMHFMSRW